jgi:hypothetical protein
VPSVVLPVYVLAAVRVNPPLPAIPAIVSSSLPETTPLIVRTFALLLVQVWFPAMR